MKTVIYYEREIPFIIFCVSSCGPPPLSFPAGLVFFFLSRDTPFSLSLQSQNADPHVFFLVPTMLLHTQIHTHAASCHLGRLTVCSRVPPPCRLTDKAFVQFWNVCACRHMCACFPLMAPANV